MAYKDSDALREMVHVTPRVTFNRHAILGVKRLYSKVPITYENGAAGDAYEVLTGYEFTLQGGIKDVVPAEDVLPAFVDEWFPHMGED